MTAPASPLTYEQASAAAAAIRAGQAAAVQDPVAAVAAMSEKIIGTRETTAAWAKAAIRRLWASVDPYDDAQVLAFARQAAALMESAQTAAARVAAAGQAQQLATAGIVVSAAPTNPVDVRGPGVVLKRGQLVLHQHAVSVDYTGADENAKVSKADMTTQGVFGRPAAVFRYAKSIDAPDAAGQAGQRIDSLVDDNLMLAQRLAQQQVLVSTVDLDTGKTRSGPKVIGYRRVIHPERSRGGTCGMCIAASDRVYHVAQLMPIHAHCQCTIAAVTEDYDPADDLNAIDLNQLYKQGGGTSVAHLKRTRYRVDEHGELGPVLVPKSKYKPQTTKSKVRVGGTALQSDQPAQADIAKHQIGVLEANLAKMQSEGVPGDSPKVAYHEKLISKLRKQVDDAAGDSTGDKPPTKPPTGRQSVQGADGDDPRLTEKVRRHILDGEPDGSGGHRYGTNNPGASEFPESWTPAKIMSAVTDTLRDPYHTQQKSGFANLIGYVGGLRVLVRVDSDGNIVTAHPLDGPGVVRNGKTDGTNKKQLPLGAVRNVPLPS